MKCEIIFAVVVGLLCGCARNQAAAPPPTETPSPKPTEGIRTLTLQYRISMDAVAPSQFVAVYPTGMTLGLKIHWKIGQEKKRELDALLTQLEKDGVNAREFTARGKWIHEGFELEVYEIERKF
ncbi:MAG: hypothetical protein ACYSWO_13040 [Planctomycetota bacterium]|jgi:hypothetical protein